MSSEVIVSVAQADELVEALNLAFEHLSSEERELRIANALRLIAAGEIDPSGILVARRDHERLAAMVSVPLAGAGALVWPTLCRNPETAERLIQSSVTRLVQRGAKVIQALVTASEMPLAEALTGHGFRHVTRLCYLSHHLGRLPALAEGLWWQSYGPAVAAEFRDTLILTYEESLDCPELNGVRNADEILAGHRAQGRFDPSRWWLARQQDLPVGVLLATQIPEETGWDLSYMGLIQGARGRGLGRALVLKALHAARAGGATELTVAVDQRNTPALQLYRSLGFTETGFREVFLHIPRI